MMRGPQGDTDQRKSTRLLSPWDASSPTLLVPSWSSKILLRDEPRQTIEYTSVPLVSFSRRRVSSAGRRELVAGHSTPAPAREQKKFTQRSRRAPDNGSNLAPRLRRPGTSKDIGWIASSSGLFPFLQKIFKNTRIIN